MTHLQNPTYQNFNQNVLTSSVPGDLFAQVDVNYAVAINKAALGMLVHLERGKALSIADIRAAMVRAFGKSDAEGGWIWKQAYEAQEVAALLFIRKYRAALAKRSLPHQLTTLEKLQSFMATQTRRSDISQRWQQFSTPLPLGYLAAYAAQLQSSDLVLEPSAGIGLLAIMAEGHVSGLVLNELEANRRDILTEVFHDTPITGYNAEILNDRLDQNIRPSVILMNPPFSTSPNAVRTDSAVTEKHIWQGIQRLAPGGRLVAITGRNYSPESRSKRTHFEKLQQVGQVSFSAPLSGSFFYKHGTSFETRLTVIDKKPAADQQDFSIYDQPMLQNHSELLLALQENLPERQPLTAPNSQSLKPTVLKTSTSLKAAVAVKPALSQKTGPQKPVVDINQGDALDYLPIEWRDDPDQKTEIQDSLYENYVPQSISIPEAKAHPTPLVQSAAMASVAPPTPTYQPILPKEIITEGILSEAQLESVIYAGQAHSQILAGGHLINHNHDFASEHLKESGEGKIREVQFRRGWFLGDGTGCGKGRQIAGIILDNRLQGRKKALWISKNDKLLEDTRRDWQALGGDPQQVVPLSKYKQGEEIILNDGILFMTYGMLRTAAKQNKISRLQQVVNWLGEDFDGPLMFDESHALANATAQAGKRGEKQASQQGMAGLRLQRALPNARVTYVSATGATDVTNLAYAERLGLWGEGTAFARRGEFMNAMAEGGVAAMELVSRDLKALGLYVARSLSYAGVEVDILEHQLTQAQIEIYDSYAQAYHIIHQNLEDALAVSCLGNNKNARSAALSVFEGTKQRFFNHILAGMKAISLTKAIEADLARGDAVIVQLVSTGEALLNRKLAEIPTHEWNDLSIDVTPREYVMEYLHKSFPIQLFENFIDEDGNAKSEPVYDENGQAVVSQEALALRDALITQLASLPEVPAAIDQIIQYFGKDQVAEVTGRQIRLIREDHKLKVDKRSASANLTETKAFMEDEKRILIFSDAGGTGRSYHADLNAKNQRRRVHYLLEPGWRADNAIQGLGRSNRTNQACPPLFRPVATDVKGEKRFLSTIARRLDTLGAITRGQRQTGGQGMFRSEDNLESRPARYALEQLYERIRRNQLPDCNVADFEKMTGLKLRDDHGSSLKENPPISRFLNRVLALPIHVQNNLFEAFETILEQILEGMAASGLLDEGVETLRADGLKILEEKEIFIHPQTGAITKCLTVERRDRYKVKTAREVLGYYEEATPIRNERSGRVALLTSAPSQMNASTGAVQECVRLISPTSSPKFTLMEYTKTFWRPVDKARFIKEWDAECAALPEYKISQFYMVTGLMLPLWDKLGKKDQIRIQRMQCDAGQRFLGRIIDATDLEVMAKNLGLEAPQQQPEDIWKGLLAGKRDLKLAQGLRLVRRLVMGEYRIEIEHHKEAAIYDKLSQLGCMHEIIQYTRRSFLPIGEGGLPIFEKLIETYPIQE